MNRTTSCVMILLIAVSCVAVASADTMVITYRSGRVQSVVMDEPSGEVQAISYLKAVSQPPEIKAKELPGKAEGQGGSKEPQPAPKKPGVTIKWAPPLEQ